MIDLTLSSEEESPPKRRRVQALKPQLNNQPLEPVNAAQPAAAAPGPTGPSIWRPTWERGEGLLGPAQPMNPEILWDSNQILLGAEAEDGDGGAGGGSTGAGGCSDPDADGRTGRGGGSGWRKPGGTRKKEEVEEDWEPGGSGSEDNGAATATAGTKKKCGGVRKRLTAEEREEQNRTKAAEKAAKEAERARVRAEKAAEKERKAAEKDELKRSKAAQKEAAKEQKEAGHALKVTMVGRYMRVLLSNCLAACPLGIKMADLIPTVRGGDKDQTFLHETHKTMPLAAKGYKYCMWGMRLPAAAAARLQAAEGCALEPSNLPDPDGKGTPLVLFPALLVVLSGDELLVRLEADSASPLAALYDDVCRAHPGASLVVYVVGLEEAFRRRERANRSFSRAAVEDLLMDVAVGMPAVRLQYDCREQELARAAIDILNLGYAISQQPRKRLEAYLETFGSKTTVPLRAIKGVLAQQGGEAQLTLCEALGQLVAPQRAAAIAAAYPSMAALIEALKAVPEGRPRDSLLSKCRIPGVVPAKGRQQVAGPVAAANVARFLATVKGTSDWKELQELPQDKD